jgi:hypothetical protein
MTGALGHVHGQAIARFVNFTVFAQQQTDMTLNEASVVWSPECVLEKIQ